MKHAATPGQDHRCRGRLRRNQDKVGQLIEACKGICRISYVVSTKCTADLADLIEGAGSLHQTIDHNLGPIGGELMTEFATITWAHRCIRDVEETYSVPQGPKTLSGRQSGNEVTLGPRRDHCQDVARSAVNGTGEERIKHGSIHSVGVVNHQHDRGID